MSESTRILEIGIGYGGVHLQHDPRQRVGLDVDEFALQVLKEEYPYSQYPNLIPVLGSGKKIPFANGAFDRIEIRFPRFTLLEGLHGEDKENWYEEFARALREDGQIRIWGDFLIDRTKVNTASRGHFFVASSGVMDLEELTQMGTYHSINSLNYTHLLPYHSKIILTKST